MEGLPKSSSSTAETSKFKKLSTITQVQSKIDPATENVFNKLSSCSEKNQLGKKLVAHVCYDVEANRFKTYCGKTETHIYVSFKDLPRDDTLEGIIFKNDFLDIKLITILGECLEDYPSLTIIKFEFCHLTAEHIEEFARVLYVLNTVKEVSVNGNPIPEQNYHVLLNRNLCCLSLKYCSINIEGMKMLCAELNRPYDYSLLHLNLASNALFDEGVYYAAKLLRMNRTLLSLNLADNKITAEGAITVMTSLQKFQLNEEEMTQNRKVKFDHQKKIIDLFLANQSRETLTSSSRRKSKFIKSKSKVLEKRSTKIGAVISGKWHTGELPLVTLPYHPTIQESVEEGDSIFCYGNNILMNLNLAFNKIKKRAIPYITAMLSYQKLKYIENPNNAAIKFISLHGNPLSNTDLYEIEEALEQKFIQSEPPSSAMF